MIKNFYYFFMFCAYILASIGGFGYAVMGGSWPVAISIVLLAIMAWPKFTEYFNKLKD